MVVFVSLGFYGIYWPWIHPAISEVRFPRMAWLDPAAGLLGRMPRSEVYELPAGFRGWVYVAEDVPACPRLNVRDGVTYFRIAADGTACTSGAQLPGAYVARHVYLDENRTELKQTGWDSGGMIWGGYSHAVEQGGKRFRGSGFFVGTEMEFRTSPVQHVPPRTFP